MSVDNIVKKIMDEAEAHAYSISEKAGRDLERLALDLDRQEKELAEAFLGKARAQAEETVKRRISSARLEKRKRILKEKDMIMGEVYAEVREQILTLPDDRYLDFLKKLVVAHSVGGDEKVILSKNDLARFKARLPQWEKDITGEALKMGKKTTVTVSVETRDIEGGLILVRGRMEINLSLDVILVETKYLVEGEVARILFGA